MSVESINSALVTSDIGLAFADKPADTGFLAQLQAEFSNVNSKMIEAEGALQDLATGKSGNIHHVMLALEDAKLSFQLLTQVRNKLLEGYQEVLRMQI